jgi:hypothetical protein
MRACAVAGIAERRKAEERQAVAPAEGVPLDLHHLRLDAAADPALLRQQYKARLPPCMPVT